MLGLCICVRNGHPHWGHDCMLGSGICAGDHGSTSGSGIHAGVMDPRWGCASISGLRIRVPGAMLSLAVLCRSVPCRGAGCSPLAAPLRGRRQLALFAGGFAHSSSWVTRLRNLSGDGGCWEL